MPTCRLCGRELKQSDLSISNWTEVSKKTFYSCLNCGGNWLYSKDLNCPILIDSKNIITRSAGGRKNLRTGHPRSTKRGRGPKARGLVKT